MKEQIDANRKFQGPGGGLQLTGGDVADAYWRGGRQDELVEIVRYAIKTGLIPMLMTHGQTLIEHPEFLEKLMVEGGLRQVAVHIDMTQAGRHGYPIGQDEVQGRWPPKLEKTRSRAGHLHHLLPPVGAQDDLFLVEEVSQIQALGFKFIVGGFQSRSPLLVRL